MQTNLDLIYSENFYHFLKKSYQLIIHSHDDYLNGMRQVEREFLGLLENQSPAQIKNQITHLRLAILAWLIDFPNSHRQSLLQQLKTNHADLPAIENIVGSQEIQHFVAMHISEITPHLIAILSFCLQILNKQNNNTAEIKDSILQEEKLIRNFYYPLIHNQLNQAYVTRLHNHCYDIDRAMQKIPNNLNQLNKNLDELKKELNNFIFFNNIIKLRWELSRDIYVLIEDFSSAISCFDFAIAIDHIEKFHTIWVHDLDRLGGMYPIVEAYIGSMMSWLSIYGFAVHLAWFSHYSQEFPALSTSLLSFSVGIELLHPCFENSFFKTPKTPKSTFRKKRVNCIKG